MVHGSRRIGYPTVAGTALTPPRGHSQNLRLPLGPHRAAPGIPLTCSTIGSQSVAGAHECVGKWGQSGPDRDPALLARPCLTDVLDGFLKRCRWVEVFYAWRPNLPDEADNHLIELGVAAQADAIVTRNLRDVARGELKFPSLRVLTPEQCLEVFPCLP